MVRLVRNLAAAMLMLSVIAVPCTTQAESLNHPSRYVAAPFAPDGLGSDLTGLAPRLLSDSGERSISLPALGATAHMLAAIQAAADMLVANQGTFTGCKYLNSSPTSCTTGSIIDTWEFEVGSGLSGHNIGGVVAMGLLDAYRVTGDPAHLAAAVAYADNLLLEFADATSSGRSDTKPFYADLELLVELTAETLDGTYATAASAWNVNRMTDVATDTGTEEADRIVDGRIAQGNGTLAGFDAGLAIIGSLAVGETVYATDLANQVLSRRVDWEAADPSFNKFNMISRGCLLAALATLDPVTYASTITEFSDFLLAEARLDDEGLFTINPAGSLPPFGGIQNASYGAMGLSGAAGSSFARTEGAMEGMKFLHRLQLDSGLDVGGWRSYPLIGDTDRPNCEVVAEALRALSTGPQPVIDTVILMADPSSIPTEDVNVDVTYTNLGTIAATFDAELKVLLYNGKVGQALPDFQTGLTLAPGATANFIDSIRIPAAKVKVVQLFANAALRVRTRARQETPTVKTLEIEDVGLNYDIPSKNPNEDPEVPPGFAYEVEVRMDDQLSAINAGGTGGVDEFHGINTFKAIANRYRIPEGADGGVGGVVEIAEVRASLAVLSGAGATTTQFMVTRDDGAGKPDFTAILANVLFVPDTVDAGNADSEDIFVFGSPPAVSPAETIWVLWFGGAGRNDGYGIDNPQNISAAGLVPFNNTFFYYSGSTDLEKVRGNWVGNLSLNAPLALTSGEPELGGWSGFRSVH